MDDDLRPVVAVGVLVLVLLLGTVGSAAVGGAGTAERYDPHSDFLVVHEEQDSGEQTLLWTYTSRATVFDARTLALNVVVRGDVDETRRHLEDVSRGSWNETDGDFEDDGVEEGYVRPNGTATAWGAADGSTRYTYVAGGGERTDEGTWLTESYQLHDGDYLGSRHHVRAYAAPEAEQEWTALQAHREHWDWFRLHHTVDSIEESQSYVEREFMGRWFVEDVYRIHAGNDHGSDSNGWLTIVEIADRVSDGEGEGPVDSVAGAGTAGAFGTVGGSGSVGSTGSAGIGGLTGTVETFLAGVPIGTVGAYGWGLWLALLGGTAVTGWRFGLVGRFDDTFGPDVRRLLTLAGTLIAVYLFVRFGAIGAERYTSLPPKPIAAVFYPIAFAGLPIVTYLLARHLNRPLAFTGASLGFLTAIMLDYTYLGVAVLPLDVMIHRGGLAVALGFIAVGASRPERFDPSPSGYIQLGVLLWLVALVLPLLRFV